MKATTCAFTGHRPSKFPWKSNEDDARCVALKAVLAEQITELVETGVRDFCSGMAEGADCYCSQIVLTLREKNPAIKLHCILPCREQADKWTASSRDLYRSILERADSIVYVSRSYHKNCLCTTAVFSGKQGNTVPCTTCAATDSWNIGEWHGTA